MGFFSSEMRPLTELRDSFHLKGFILLDININMEFQFFDDEDEKGMYNGNVAGINFEEFL